MTLRTLRYEVFCTSPEERMYRRTQAERELASLVPGEMHDAVSWQEYEADEFYRISWSLRMDDETLLRPLDD